MISDKGLLLIILRFFNSESSKSLDVIITNENTLNGSSFLGFEISNYFLSFLLLRSLKYVNTKVRADSLPKLKAQRPFGEFDCIMMENYSFLD